MWVQFSPDGGIFEHSDSFHVLDFRVPFHSFLMGAGSSGTHQCFVSLSRARHEISLEVMYTLPELADNELDRMQQWQFSTTDFCSAYNLEPAACILALSQLSNCMYMKIEAAKETLPIVQYAPTPIRPFVFLHVEKVGGTSLRT